MADWRETLAMHMAAAMLQEDDFTKMAMAALAVAEPAIRERCAVIANNACLEGEDPEAINTAEQIAGAIREDGNDG